MFIRATPRILIKSIAGVKTQAGKKKKKKPRTIHYEKKQTNKKTPDGTRLESQQEVHMNVNKRSHGGSSTTCCKTEIPDNANVDTKAAI